MASRSVVVKDFRKDVPCVLENGRCAFPVVSTTNSHGAVSTWQIFVGAQREDGSSIPLTDEMLDNKPINVYGVIEVVGRIGNGKVRDVVPTVVKTGKNIGKKNETNPVCQAIRDAYGLYLKQKTKSVGSADASGLTSISVQSEAAGSSSASDVKCHQIFPMLAQRFDQFSVKISDENPVWVQRKYNGVRCVASLCSDGNVLLSSRNKKMFPGMNSIKKSLQNFMDNDTLIDGEIYKHGASLQTISGVVRNAAANDDGFSLIIYDCFPIKHPQMTYSHRLAILEDMFATRPKSDALTLAETFVVSSKSKLDGLYSQFIDEGFEGAMVRLDAPYRHSANGYHTNVLLKIKPLMDAEFEVVGWTTGDKGKAANAIMIVCRTANGKEFMVTPALELSEREQMAAAMDVVENGITTFDRLWKGKEITVFFDELSDEGIPLRARTKLEQRVD